MLEILKKAGVSATIATAIVLAITVVPMYQQYKFMAETQLRLKVLEKTLEEQQLTCRA
jgi:hypothetical protein